MSVAHPWFLLLALAPVLWAAWEWRSAGRRSALLLKAAALLALLTALAGPSITVYSSKLAVAILADTSASVSADDLAAESDFAARADRSRGRHWLRVIPFARTVRDAAPEELDANTLHLRHTAGSAGRATDLEAALRDGVASLPAGMVPRLVRYPTVSKTWAALPAPSGRRASLASPSIPRRWPAFPSPVCFSNRRAFPARYIRASASPSWSLSSHRAPPALRSR